MSKAAIWLDLVDPDVRKIFEGLDDARNGPSLVKPPREIGEPLSSYKRLPPPDRLELIKLHMRALTDAEWSKMSREMRGNLRIRLCNDEVINALLRAWALD